MEYMELLTRRVDAKVARRLLYKMCVVFDECTAGSTHFVFIFETVRPKVKLNTSNYYLTSDQSKKNITRCRRTL